MSPGLNPGPTRQRIVIVALTMLALSVASGCIYYSLNASKETAKQAVKSEPAPVLATKTLDDNTQTAAITELTVDPVSVPTAEEQKAAASPAPKRASRSKFHSSRNKVAALFPAPPRVVSGPSNQGPNGTVEMWQGDRREFISVPPGTETHSHPRALPKYEEPSASFTF